MSRASLFSFCSNYSWTDITPTPRDSPYLARVFDDPGLDKVGVLFVLAATISDEALHSYRATQYDPIPPLELGANRLSRSFRWW
jgi:hypothetical protein